MRGPQAPARGPLAPRRAPVVATTAPGPSPSVPALLASDRVYPKDVPPTPSGAPLTSRTVPLPSRDMPHRRGSQLRYRSAIPRCSRRMPRSLVPSPQHQRNILRRHVPAPRYRRTCREVMCPRRGIEGIPHGVAGRRFDIGGKPALFTMRCARFGDRPATSADIARRRGTRLTIASDDRGVSAPSREVRRTRREPRGFARQLLVGARRRLLACSLPRGGVPSSRLAFLEQR